MSYKRKSQQTLQLASYLFLLVGLVAFFEMAIHAARGLYHFNFSIFGIGIFAGLRRHSPVWRVCALVFTWYNMVTIAIGLFVCLYVQAPASFPLTRGPAEQLASIPINWAAVPLVMLFLIMLWQYRVLTHPAIRRLFATQPQTQPVEQTQSIPDEIEGAPAK